MSIEEDAIDGQRVGRGLSGRESGGATQRINRRDPVVNRIVKVFWGALSLASVGVAAWFAHNLADLNTNVTTLIAQMNSVIVKQAQKDAHDEYQDSRIDNLTGDVRRLEGKTFRGVDGFGPAKESSHGH